MKVILQVGGLGGLIGLADKQRHLPEILIGVIPSVARGSTMRVAEPLCALSSANAVIEKADSKVAISRIMLSILFKLFLLSESN